MLSLKKVLYTLLITTLFTLLFAVAACAAEYPGLIQGISYWTLGHPIYDYGLDNHNNPDVSRFSIDGVMEFNGTYFTFDPNKRQESSPVPVTLLQKDTSSNAYFVYNSADCGFKFIPTGSSDKYYICTVDGYYLKRTGSYLSPGLGYTQNQSSATAFAAKCDSGGTYRIYESVTTGYNQITSVWDKSLGAYRLSLKHRSAYDDVGFVCLYRRCYTADCYVELPMVRYDGTAGMTETGPYNLDNTSSTASITVPCYFHNAYPNNHFLPDEITVRPLLAEAQVYQVVYVNGVLEWNVRVPDAPLGDNIVTYRRNILIQDHQYADRYAHIIGDYWVTLREPTCTQTGLRARPCINASLDAIFHHLSDPSAWHLENNPCDACRNEEEIPKLPHDLGDTGHEIAASCTYPAYFAGYCSLCQKYVVQDDPSHPALGHSLVYHAAQAPTCTEAGWDAYQLCTRCNVVLDLNGNEIGTGGTPPALPALDHDWGENTCFLSQDGHTLSVGRVCGRCGLLDGIQADLSGDGSANEPWQIGSAEQWDLIAAATAYGLDTYGKHFKLLNDISVSAMIGTEGNPFGGCFDGAGHALTLSLTTSERYAAPFRYVSGASFTHLRVTGALTSSGSDAGGLVGSALGGCSIADCIVDADITASAGGGHSGFVAMCSSGTVSVTGSAFTGSITAPNAGYCAGFLGWQGSTVDDSVYAGTMNTGSASNDFIRTSDYAANCYSLNLNGIQRVKGLQAVAVTEDEGVTLDFGTPKAAYTTSGITAYETGLIYNGVFYAGPGQTVTLTLAAEAPEGMLVSGFTASGGTLAQNGDAWTLTMPSEDVVINAVLVIAPFGTPDFILPAALTTVEAEAFEGIAASVVDIPANCTSIGDHAFRNCPNLTQIRIPENCALGVDVFDGCAMVYVFGTADSPAESYCSTHANCVFVAAE